VLRPAHVAALLLGALALFAAPAEAACVAPSRWTVGTYTLPEERRPALEAPQTPLHEHFTGDPRRAPEWPVELDELEDSDEQTCARRRHRRHEDRRRPARRLPRPDRPGAKPKPTGAEARRSARRSWPAALVARRAAVRPPVVTPRLLATEGARPP